jgi:hypothetical protein
MIHLRMPGPEVCSVDDTRDVLCRVANCAHPRRRTGHARAVDDRMVQDSIQRQIVQFAVPCRKRDEPLMPRVRPTRAPAAVFHRTHALRVAFNRARLKTFFVRALGVGPHLMDALPNRIPHNATCWYGSTLDHGQRFPTVGRSYLASDQAYLARAQIGVY